MISIKQILFILLPYLFLFSCAINKPKPIKSFYNSKEIRDFTEWKFDFGNGELKYCDFYIVDGVPYQNEKIDSVLKRYNKTDFGIITIIKKPKDNTFWDNPCDLISILRTKQQSEKEKRQLLEKAMELYQTEIPNIIIRDWICTKCPMLSVNNKIIWNPYEMKRITKELKVSEIEFIAEIQQPLNPKTFGKYGKNGIVEITLK